MRDLAEVSMNLQPNDRANCLPSVGICQLLLYVMRFRWSESRDA